MKGLLVCIIFLPLLLPAQNYLLGSASIPVASGKFYDAANLLRAQAQPCNMFADLFSTSDVLCDGDTTGSAIISVSNASPPVLFYLDNIITPFLNGDLINILSNGNHSVLVVDGDGCRDTVNFFINAPPLISISSSGTDVLCNGDNSGTLLATATGGAGGIAFAWRDCLGGTTFGGAAQSNMFAGCYEVTATDGNGCTSTAVVTLSEPAPYVFNSTQDSVSCNGLSDGVASLSVAGGTPPYQYLWDNGSSNAVATNLNAGFHFVTVTDGNLCSASTLVELLEPSILLISNTQSQFSSCFDGSNGTASVFATGGTPVYAYLWDDPAAQTTQKADSLAAGTYNVTITDSNGCSAQTSVIVTSPPELLLSFTQVTPEICVGDCLGSATVNPVGGAGGYQYTWSSMNIPNGVQSPTNLCPGSYRVTVEHPNGCTEVGQVLIEPAQPIDIRFTPISPTCVGLQNGSIEVQVSGGSAPYQYLWSNGATADLLQNLSCGVYGLTLTDSGGCVKNYSVIVDCPQDITVTSIVPQAVLCFGGNTGSITLQAQGGSMPLSYVWNDPAAQTIANAQNLASGVYTVTISDLNGCSTTASATVTEPLQLDVNITHTNVSCLNDGDGTASANAIGGIPPYLYDWGAAGNTPGLSNLAAGVYFLTVTDANLCTVTASVTITQPSTIVMVNAMQTRFACFGERDAEAAVSASGSNGAPFTFNWSNGQMGGGASNLAAGLYTVTATDPKGCTASQTVVIQALDSISLLTIYAPPTCAGAQNGIVAVVLIEGGLGMGDSTQYTYNWSLPGAPNSTVVSGFSAGNYSLTATDFQGCSAVFGIVVKEPLPLSAQLSGKDVSCFGFSDGSVEVDTVLNAVGGISYQWDNNETTQQIRDLPIGNYQVTATDSKGCTAVEHISIQQPDTLRLSFQIQSLVCATDSNARIQALITGGTPDYTYQWSNGATDLDINDLGPGNYTLQATDQNGCIISGSVLVDQPNAMVLNLELTEPECFDGQDGRIRLMVTGGVIPYRYSLNGGPFGGSSAFIALKSGTYSIQVKDVNGCIASAEVMLNQPPQVQVSVGLDTTIVLGDSLLISATVNNAVGLSSYAWSGVLLDSLTCVDSLFCDAIWVQPGNTNTYRLKVTDEKGCMGKDEIRITVEKPRGIYVPSGFTPNGDLENDLLVVHGKEKQVSKVLSFKIFDRWGEMVYTDQNFGVNDATRGWDGTFRGQDCDPAVFVWVLEAVYKDGHSEVLKGNVTLIR